MRYRKSEASDRASQVVNTFKFYVKNPGILPNISYIMYRQTIDLIVRMYIDTSSPFFVRFLDYAASFNAKAAGEPIVYPDKSRSEQKSLRSGYGMTQTTGMVSRRTIG